MAIKAFHLFGEVELKGDKAVVSNLKNVSHQVDKTGKDLGKLKGNMSFGGGMLSGLNSALGTLSNISNTIQGIPVVGKLIDGAFSLATGPIKDTAQLGLAFNQLRENATIAFSVILKDGEKAKKLFNDLAEFGRVSPIFKTNELIGGAQLFLKNVGPGPELFETLKGIGAITAATGHLENMERNFQTFKQVMDKPKLSAEEMTQQFPEAFVDAWGLLARARGQTVAEVQALTTAGKLSGPGSAKLIIQQGLREFGSIVDLMGESDSGLDAQIADTFEQLAARATGGKGGAFETIKGGKQRLLTLLNSPKGAELADKISGGMSAVGPQLLGGIDSLLDGSLLTKMQKAGEDVKAGISQGFDGVKTGVGNAVEYVTGFKTGIGAHSPATEFIPLGQYSAQGWLLGWDSEMIAAGGPMALFQGKGAHFAAGQQQTQRRAENERLLQHPAIQAMMDAIGVGEGTFDPKTGQRNWMKWFGNAPFTPTAEHPGVSPVPFFNRKTGKWDHSSAAGGGQFLQGTWAGAEKDVGDLAFNNLHDQEIAFVEKMRDRGMIGPLLQGDIRKAMALGAPEWASLPGSPYKQPTVKEGTVIDTFEKRLGFYANGQPITATNPMPVTIAPSAQSDALGGKVPALTDKKLLDDFNATQLTAQAIKNVNAVMAAGQAMKNVSVALGIQTKITEEKAVPGLQKLGETAELTAEQIAANRKMSDLEGADKAAKQKKNKQFDSAFKWEGVAGDFGGNLQGLLGNLGWGESAGSLGKQALFDFIRDAQSRLAHDFSAMITGGLFGFPKGGEGADANRLTGGLLSSILGRLFGGSGSTGGAGGGLASLFGGFRESGGGMSPGRFYIAGERGPEIVSGPGHVYNARETRAMMQGGGDTHVFFALGDDAVTKLNDRYLSSRNAARQVFRIQARYGKLLGR